jgi:diguanylate cyclase (GGDEF)-like protein
MLCALIWVVGFIFETAFPSLQAKILFAKLEFIGITFLPNAWLYLAFAYSGRLPARRVLLGLSAVPVLTNLLIWLVPAPNWFWGRISLDFQSAPFPVLNPDYQFWFYGVHAASGYLYTLTAMLLVIRSIAGGQPIYRKQGLLLLGAILLPAVTDILYVLGYSPLRYYNFTVATFSLSGLILGWNLLGFQFLHLLPLARDVVFENLSDGIIILNDRNWIVDFNPSASRIARLSASSLGQPPISLGLQWLAAVAEMQASGQIQRDVEIGGEATGWYDLKLAPIRTRSGRRLGWVVTLSDITERTNRLRHIMHVASHDALTGILNRGQFLVLAEMEFAHFRQDASHQLSFIAIDVDNYKYVNDTYGHLAGDQVLAAFTTECQDCLRADDLFGRLGGDEFGILLVADRTDARTIAERLRDRINNLSIELPGGPIGITASLGLTDTSALSTADGLEALMLHADQALYRAKQAGKNQVVVQGDE